MYLYIGCKHIHKTASYGFRCKILPEKKTQEHEIVWFWPFFFIFSFNIDLPWKHKPPFLFYTGKTRKVTADWWIFSCNRSSSPVSIFSCDTFPGADSCWEWTDAGNQKGSFSSQPALWHRRANQKQYPAMDPIRWTSLPENNYCPEEIWIVE